VIVTYESRVLEAYEGEGLTEWALGQEDQALPEAFDRLSRFIGDGGSADSCSITGFGGAGANIGSTRAGRFRSAGMLGTTSVGTYPGAIPAPSSRSAQLLRRMVPPGLPKVPVELQHQPVLGIC
jgi:hypothetical protein